MRNLIFFLAAALLASAVGAASVGVASAKGLFAAWNNCYNATPIPGITAITFDCTQGEATVYQLFHNFTIDAAVPGVIAAQGIVDFNFPEDATSPPWWEMASGGCNDGSIGFDYLRGHLCGGSSDLLCGTTADICSGSDITSITYQSGRPNRNRAIINLVRPTDSPVTLTAGRHYAWEIDFPIDNPNGLGPCQGCDHPCIITWNGLEIFDNAGGVTQVTGADAGYPEACADWTQCVDLPVKAKTWGQLKTLYR